MHPRDLPKLGMITNPHWHDFYGMSSHLAGKRLLCLGLSADDIRNLVVPFKPASVEILTYWADHVDAVQQEFSVVIGDITKRTPFANDSFDAILTFAVLEHLHGLDAAFDEMIRMLRPGGEMMHVFGPAWSCAYGHHLYVNADDENLNFSSWSLPAHMHLLSSEFEIAGYYRELGYSDETVKWVLDDMFRKSLINRAFYDDYEAVMGRRDLQIDRVQLMYNELPSDHLKRLRANFPGRKDFSTYGGSYRVLVRK